MQRFLLSFLLISILGCTTGPSSPPGTSEKPQGPEDVLLPETWLNHMKKDLIPFWTTKEALGTPLGNYPTLRGFDGRLLEDQDKRLPRMMGRQIFFYSVAYLMTGDPKLLEYAQAGVTWLIEKAWDRDHGGWYGELAADGSPEANPKYAQDMAYAAQGLAAYFFVTRDPKAEEYLLKTRDVIFNPKTFWDEKNQRVKDGMDFKLTQDLDQAGGGWELVALLDQVNAYKILAAPVLTQEKDRRQWAQDLQTLGASIKKYFWKDGIFWGQADRVGRGGRHVDFGHTFKSYWMLYLIDQTTGSQLSQDLWEPYVPKLLDLAFDNTYGLWASGPRGPTEVHYGSSWWIYAECDQILATMNLVTQGRYTQRLERTLQGWLKYYVDPKFGEIVPDIKRDGSPGSNWPEFSSAKVGEWKNGFHSAEHALISYIHAAALAGKETRLYFAFPLGQTPGVRPYIFPGKEVQRTPGEMFQIAGKTYQQVACDLKVEWK